MSDTNKTTRVGKKFNDEIEKIKKARVDSGKDKKKKSTKTLTNLIIEHKGWGKIRKDTIEINLEGKK